MDQEKTKSILEFIHQKFDLEMSVYESRFERLELELQRAISRFEAKA